MRNIYQIAERMNLIDASGIRKVFDLAAKMADPINLSIGQPDFDVPDSVKAKAVEAIQSGFNKYTQTQGMGPLREVLSRKCSEEFGWSDERDYLVTSGVSGALALAMLALVNPGDEVIILDPYFVMYSHLIHLAGGIPILVDTYDDFQVDVQRITDAITDKTRMLIINSPANPTGVVLPREILSDIADVARKHDLLVLSDEIYLDFCYDEPFTSMADVYENTLLMRGFSKSHAMTGWRIGWVTGPTAIMDKMTMLQQYSFVCAPSMAQVAAIEALDCDMSAHVASYKTKRDMVYKTLSPVFDLPKPGGAFYAFPAAPGGDATRFVEKVIASGVLIIPGNVFSARDTHFRISYATSDEKLAEGLGILVDIAS